MTKGPVVLWGGGMWRIRPDDNGNFGDIQIARSGQACCGTLVQSF